MSSKDDDVEEYRSFLRDVDAACGLGNGLNLAVSLLENKFFQGPDSLTLYDLEWFAYSAKKLFLLLKNISRRGENKESDPNVFDSLLPLEILSDSEMINRNPLNVLMLLAARSGRNLDSLFPIVMMGSGLFGSGGSSNSGLAKAATMMGLAALSSSECTNSPEESKSDTEVKPVERKPSPAKPKKRRSTSKTEKPASHGKRK